MRFVSCEVAGRRALAALTGNELRGFFVGESDCPAGLHELIAGGTQTLAAAHAKLLRGRLFDEASVQYLPPLSQSRKIICVGLNYADHTAEAGYQPPKFPTIFSRFASSLLGHRQPMIQPRASASLDYEGELVAVIGKGGRHISRAAALDHVVGYSIFNDGSVREYQKMTPQWTMGKNFDATGAFGPAFVTADELPAGASGLKIETRLNGEVMQSSNTRHLIFDVATLVEFVSSGITLESGDIIVTGTPAGIGAVRKPPLYMKPGDVCEVEIEGLGVLTSPIAAE